MALQVKLVSSILGLLELTDMELVNGQGPDHMAAFCMELHDELQCKVA